MLCIVARIRLMLLGKMLSDQIDKVVSQLSEFLLIGSGTVDALELLVELVDVQGS